MFSQKKPVLVIGGSGIVGSQTAKTLRRFHPDLPITIGGRDLAKAQRVADEIGGAYAVTIDLERVDLGLSADASFSAIAVFVKDETLHSMKYAQAMGVPYVSLSSGTFEIGPEVAQYVHAPDRAPILLASHWMAGAAVLPILYFAKEFRSLESIAVAAVLDEEDMGGPAAWTDYERITKVSPSSLIKKDGNWMWASSKEGGRSFDTIDGVTVQGQLYSPFDMLSLGALTDATSLRFDFTLGQSASRRRGESFSTEVIIELVAERHDGTQARVRHDMVHPAGQVPVTALAIAIGVERLLGLTGGAPVEPGLYLPESIIDPSYMMQRLTESGAQFQRTG